MSDQPPVVNRGNAEQWAAAQHRDGPAIVIAPPGSGKTFVNQLRTVALLESGVPASAILVVTFTNKAVGANAERIASAVDPETAQAIGLSTVHALARKVLVAAERKTSRTIPEIADQGACFDYLKQAGRELGISDQISILDVYQQIQKWKATESRDYGSLPDITGLVLKRFESILKAEKKWDMSDMIINATKALEENSDILAAFSGYQNIMVDEWQDTSMSQYKFIRTLLGQNENLFVVGDPNQSIYEWAGAYYKQLSACFERDYPNAVHYFLKNTYRMRAVVAQTASALMKDQSGADIEAVKPGGQVIFRELENNLAEANQVAEVVAGLHNRDDLAYKSVTVLIRNWSQSGPLQQAFINAGIPFQLFGEKEKYYRTGEVQALFSYLKIANMLSSESPDLDDKGEYRFDGAIDRIINTPSRGIGQRSIKMIRGGKSQIGWSELMNAMVRPDLTEQVRTAISALFNMLSALACQVDTITPAEMVSQIIKDTEWELSLADELEGSKIIKNLHAFEEEAGEFATVGEFVTGVAPKFKAEIGDNGVVISTIHTFKGLESPVVFLIGANQGVLPSAQAVLWAANGDPLEERRLFYVAVSRAESLLFITWVKEQISAGEKVKKLKPSQFLSLLPADVMEEYNGINRIKPVVVES